MKYFTLSSDGTMIDSISESYFKLKDKFPGETIYQIDKIDSIYSKKISNLIAISTL